MSDSGKICTWQINWNDAIIESALRLIWILPVTNKGTSRREGTFGTHRNVDCLLKNTSIKHKKYVVNQKLKYFDDISFTELYGRILVSFYKMRFFFSFLRQVTCFYVCHSLLWNIVGLVLLICVLVFSGYSCVDGIEVKCLMLLHEERGLECIHSNRF